MNFTVDLDSFLAGYLIGFAAAIFAQAVRRWTKAYDEANQ